MALLGEIFVSRTRYISLTYERKTESTVDTSHTTVIFSIFLGGTIVLNKSTGFEARLDLINFYMES